MPTCLILSELPQREKETIMLLLAAADDNAWRAVRDEWNNLYIKWQVKSTHPALSFLPLTPADVKQQKQQEEEERLERQQQQKQKQKWNGDAITREHCGASPLANWTSRAHSTSPFLRNSLSFNGGPNADCSPWTIDRNTDSAVTAEQFYTSNTSHPFASNYSPQTQKLQKQQQQQQQQRQQKQPQYQYQQQRVRGGSTSSMSARGQRGSSQRVRGGTPFLNGRSVFLRRSSTPRQSSLSHPTLSERSASRRNGSSVTSAKVSNADEAPSHSTTVRSAQWVSRLVEDIMGYVAKLISIDNRQIESVASLTVTVLKARYGAFQWNKMLKELAYGLHRYHSISPLCRIFRELFVDQSSSALEDLSLFARLHRTAVKYSTIEMQKIVLPYAMKNEENVDDDTSNSFLQYTIASRRYVELHLLTTVLTEMLMSVTILESGNVSKKSSVSRRRKLKTAEVVGVKAIVAYWVEEESSNCDSLAFDLGGFVDLHEVIAVVVSALRSSQSPNVNENPNTVNTVIKQSRKGNDVQSEKEKLKIQMEGRGKEDMTYVAHSRSIVQPQEHIPEGSVRFIGKSKDVQTTSPSVVSKSAQFPANYSENSALKSEATDSANVQILLRGVSEEEKEKEKRNEPDQYTQESVNHTTAQNQDLRVSQRDNPLKGKTVRECTFPSNNGKPSTLAASRREVTPPTEVHTASQQTSGGPLVVDLDPKLLSGHEKPSPHYSLLSKHLMKQNVKTQQDGTEMQPQQYFAALAAIDAELQRRREFLTSTVAIDLTKREKMSNTPVRFDEQTTSTKWNTPSPRRSQSQQDSTYTAVVAELAKPIESTAPPANADTFNNVNRPPMAVQRPPSSILMPSKYQTQVKPVVRREEEEEEEKEKEEEEGFPMSSDLEMLTDEERHLLAELRQALSHQT